MNLRKVVRAAFAAIAALSLCGPAFALPPTGLFRAYVASTGADTNPCTLALPCRLLPAALAAVTDGGQIWMLDSANYNTATVNITKSVSILAIPGAVGSVVATGTDAIDIGSAGVTVALRNLVIAPLSGAAGAGISVLAPADLTVENCIFENLTLSGISVTAPANVRVSGSTFRSDGSGAILVNESTTASSTFVDVSGSTFGRSANAAIALLSGNSTAAVTASVTNNTMIQGFVNGVQVSSSAGGNVWVSVTNNVISNNFGTGVAASGAGVRVWASGNTVSANSTGFSNSSAIFESPGNNALRNNTTDTVGTISPTSGT